MKPPTPDSPVTSRRLLLALAFSVLPSALLAQGSLTPPGAPAPTLKTLDQVEPRTPISSVPFTITNSGSYYLTASLNVTNGDAITIATNGATLDLNGFTLSSTKVGAAGYGISLGSGLRNLTIQNGFIQSGVTNNGSGVYSGNGFQYGIRYSGSQPKNVLVSRVSVAGVLTDGINLGENNSTIVESCTALTAGSSGIHASVIRSSAATDCGYAAIFGEEVSDSRGATTGGTYGLYANTANNCYGSSGGTYGLYAAAANNCYGSTTSTNASTYGLYATTADNCYGSGGGSGVGLGGETVNNSFGYNSVAGFGLYAAAANNCYGFSGTGTGLYATTANNCTGSSTSGTGLRALLIATSCNGLTSGAAARALDCDGTANSCSAQNSVGGTAIKAAIGIGCVKLVGTNNITSVFLGTVSP